MAVLDGDEQVAIGDGRAIRRMRHRFNYEKSRLRRLARFRHGHGRKHKSRPVVLVSDREHRYADTVAAQVAASIVQTAKRWRVGTIALEDGLKFPVHTRGGRVFWTPSMVKQKIRNAAELAEIDVLEVPPKNTSQRCSECGLTDPENRDDRRFVCKECGVITHADLNAARNIAALAVIHHLVIGLRVVGGSLLGTADYEAIKSLVRGLRAACKEPVQPKRPKRDRGANGASRDRLQKEPRAVYAASSEVPAGGHPISDVAASPEGVLSEGSQKRKSANPQAVFADSHLAGSERVVGEEPDLFQYVAQRSQAGS